MFHRQLISVTIKFISDWCHVKKIEENGNKALFRMFTSYNAILTRQIVYLQNAKYAFAVVVVAFLVCSVCMFAVQGRPQDAEQALCLSCCHSMWNACLSQCQGIFSLCYECSVEKNLCVLECPGSCTI